VVRRHEWELLIAVLSYSRDIFVAKVMEKFAENLIMWIREQRRQEKSKGRDIHCSSEIRVDNRQAVRVDETTIPKDALVQLMSFAAKNGLRVHVILEPYKGGALL